MGDQRRGCAGERGPRRRASAACRHPPTCERNRVMDKRKLGANGPEVSEIGLGCMGMSAFYGSSDEGESLRTIARALELGCNFLDTSDMYGPHTNEELV